MSINALPERIVSFVATQLTLAWSRLADEWPIFVVAGASRSIAMLGGVWR